MNIELDSVPLTERTDDQQKGIMEKLRVVYNISTNVKRAIVEHEIPGSDMSVFQDMGKEPISISFFGEMAGVKSKGDLTDLWTKYKLGKPLPFLSDITALSDVKKVMIEELAIEHTAGIPNSYRYSMTLSEFREPPPQPKTPPSQTQQAKKQVKKESEIDDIRGQILDVDGNPAKDVTVNVSGPDGERQTTTDDEGYYEFQEVPEGKYEITVDEEGYEDQKGEVEVKKGAGGEGGEEGEEEGEGEEESEEEGGEES